MKTYPLSPAVSRHNFRAYLWHALFLALAQNFMDVDTIVPAMILDAGGSSLHIGLLTAIMVGGSAFMQIAFSPFLNNRAAKKSYLLAGIGLRVSALLGLGILLWLVAGGQHRSAVLPLIFVLITLFSLGGSFAAISYTDILGKSLLPSRRKAFFSLRQAMMSVGVLASALLASRLLNLYAYPLNYAALFVTAGLSLAVAALGFWQVKEVTAGVNRISSFGIFWQRLTGEIRQNERLRGYLLLVNTLGVSLSLLPFLILYGKQYYQLDNTGVGQFLVYKVTAGVVAGLGVYYLNQRIRYRQMLHAIALLALLIPLHLIWSGTGTYFAYYFFLGGIIFTLYKVAMEGILLEVSRHDNRALYAGLAGAGNLVPALFPVLGGWLIGQYGFRPFFGLYLMLIGLSILFIYRLKCFK